MTLRASMEPPCRPCRMYLPQSRLHALSSGAGAGEGFGATIFPISSLAALASTDSQPFDASPPALLLASMRVPFAAAAEGRQICLVSSGRDAFHSAAECYAVSIITRTDR